MRWKIPTRLSGGGCQSRARRCAPRGVGRRAPCTAAKLNLLEQELISLPARQASATARRDLAAAKLDKLAKRIPIIEARVNTLKEAEAAKQQAAADREAQRLSAQHPAARSLREGHGGHSPARSRCNAALDEGKSKLAEVQADIARVRDSKVAAQQVLEIGSIGGEFSELLRAMRAQLPETARLQRRICGP